MDERNAVLGACARKQRRAGRVCRPGDAAALRGLRGIDCRVGAAIDHGAVERPIELTVGRRVAHVEGIDIAEVKVLGDAALLGERAHGAAELAIATGDECPLGSHGNDVGEHRVMLVGFGKRRLLERNGPLDAERGIGEVHEGIGLL